MKLGYNFINGLVIFISLVLFILFKYYKNNTILGGMIIVLTSVSGTIFGILKQNRNLIICLYSLFLFIFYWVSDTYEDNYSIKALIDEFGLRENDRLNYKLLMSRNGEMDKCKITGIYDKETGNILKPKTDSEYCNEIKKQTDFNFIHGSE